MTASGTEAAAPPLAPEADREDGDIIPHPRTIRSLFFPEPLPDPRERPASFLGTSTILGEIRLDVPAGADVRLGGEVGIRIGNLEYTGFDLSDKAGDNTLTFHLSSGQRSTWDSLSTAHGDPFGALAGLPALDSFALVLEGLDEEAAGLPLEDVLDLAGERLRSAGALLRGSDPSLAPALSGIDPALLQPIAATLDALIEHFYYERPGEIGLRNLELRGEASGSTASQYRYRTAGGSEVYAEIVQGARLSTEEALGLRVTYGPESEPGSDLSLRTRYHQRSASISSTFGSFTVGRDRWALAVSEIEHAIELSLDAARIDTAVDGQAALGAQTERERAFDSAQVENRIWALRRGRLRGWEVEAGIGLGSLRSRSRSSDAWRDGAGTADSPAAALPGAPLAEGSLAAGDVAIPPAGAAFAASVREESDAPDLTRAGAGILLGVRRVRDRSEAGMRAIHFGRLRQQATAAVGRSLSAGRLGLVADLQADLVRQPGARWDEEEEEYHLETLSAAALTPTGALVWSLEEEALAGLHSWQSPFEPVARRRDPRRLGRALFAGASGRGAEEVFAGLSFGRGSYLSASLRQGEGSVRHYTLSGRARSLLLEVGLGSGYRPGVEREDDRQEISLSYLQLVYNRDGERFFSLTFNPERRGLDLAMAANASSLGASLKRAWARVRRIAGL